MRRARSDEAAAVAALVEAAFARHVAAVGRRPAPMDDDHAARITAGEQYVRDAEDGTPALASSIVLVDNGDHLVVNNVAARPDLQGQGLGRDLLAFAEDEARRRGFAEIRLHTNAAMADNILMYPKLGYTETGRETRSGFHRVLFIKPLT
ncbi:GNAT family N-acetyltransferase [Conexibacter woesei]|uniref:GNAT family N-acetyltransferase n=1 Tax=Conexibacter woesei TaxID=191495 RepID=UPI000415E761|nr:GNAT family N-acetyltransferase [Conexibacter woesei]